MWPFTKKYNLEQSELFKGFTDWHCHLLPGVDDGVQEIDETLRILDRYESLGVRRIWLTPHIMEDFPNEPESLKQGFESLKQAYGGSIKLNLAAENMLDNLFDQRLAADRLLTIGDSGNMVLVETSYYEAPTGMDQKIETVQKKGLTPLLAHPERYIYMDKRDYESLLGRGVKFQMNLFSFFGMYGPEARDKAQMLLKAGAYSCVGTDTHKMRHLEYALTTKALTSKDIDMISSVMSRMA